MKIKCLIVDDEALARKGLEKYIQEIDFLELKGVCKNAMEANKLINEQQVDLLFLDIEMPMISGLDLLKSLQAPPKVIFTTAYSEYAIDSFEFEVIDYLVKPISFDRFLKAVNKAYRMFNTQGAPVETKSPDNKTSQDQFVFIKTENQLVKVFLKDIRYIQSMQNYIRIHLDGDILTTLIPLKKILEILPDQEFLQIHKSFIISIPKVEAIVGNQVLIGKDKLPIARSLKEKIMQKLVKDKLLKK